MEQAQSIGALKLRLAGANMLLKQRSLEIFANVFVDGCRFCLSLVSLLSDVKVQ